MSKEQEAKQKIKTIYNNAYTFDNNKYLYVGDDLYLVELKDNRLKLIPTLEESLKNAVDPFNLESISNQTGIINGNFRITKEGLSELAKNAGMSVVMEESANQLLAEFEAEKNTPKPNLEALRSRKNSKEAQPQVPEQRERADTTYQTKIERPEQRPLDQTEQSTANPFAKGPEAHPEERPRAYTEGFNIRPIKIDFYQPKVADQNTNPFSSNYPNFVSSTVEELDQINPFITPVKNVGELLDQQQAPRVTPPSVEVKAEYITVGTGSAVEYFIADKRGNQMAISRFQDKQQSETSYNRSIQRGDNPRKLYAKSFDQMITLYYDRKLVPTNGQVPLQQNIQGQQPPEAQPAQGERRKNELEAQQQASRITPPSVQGQERRIFQMPEGYFVHVRNNNGNITMREAQQDDRSSIPSIQQLVYSASIQELYKRLESENPGKVQISETYFESLKWFHQRLPDAKYIAPVHEQQVQNAIPGGNPQARNPRPAFDAPPQARAPAQNQRSAPVTGQNPVIDKNRMILPFTQGYVVKDGKLPLGTDYLVYAKNGNKIAVIDKYGKSHDAGKVTGTFVTVRDDGLPVDPKTGKLPKAETKKEFLKDRTAINKNEIAADYYVEVDGKLVRPVYVRNEFGQYDLKALVTPSIHNLPVRRPANSEMESQLRASMKETSEKLKTTQLFDKPKFVELKGGTKLEMWRDNDGKLQFAEVLPDVAQNLNRFHNGMVKSGMDLRQFVMAAEAAEPGVTSKLPPKIKSKYESEVTKFEGRHPKAAKAAEETVKDLPRGEQEEIRTRGDLPEKVGTGILATILTKLGFSEEGIFSKLIKWSNGEKAAPQTRERSGSVEYSPLPTIDSDASEQNQNAPQSQYADFSELVENSKKAQANKTDYGTLEGLEEVTQTLQQGFDSQPPEGDAQKATTSKKRDSQREH